MDEFEQDSIEGCIAEQDIRHTCGGLDDLPHSTPQSIAHNHPVHHPPAQINQPSWEEPPLHYHRPPHYPPVDYRGYPPPNSQTNFEDKNFLYSPTSPSYHPPGQYGGERRSHEASSSQMKRSKSAHLQYESQGFVPYSREPYHYPYPHLPSGYNPHAFHPHIHGYYPPPHPGTAPPHMYSHYPPTQSGHKAAMYHECKTCSSSMAEYGYIPREHLYHHEHVSADIPSNEMAYQQSSSSASSPKRQPSVEHNDSIDTSPTDQGYVSQSEKMDSSVDHVQTSSLDSTTAPTSKSVMEDFFNSKEEHSQSEDMNCTLETSVSSDMPVSSVGNYDNSISGSVFTNTAQVTLLSSTDNNNTVVVGGDDDDTTTAATTTHAISVVSSSHIEDNNVDIIPERDTNPSDVTSLLTESKREFLESDAELHPVHKSIPISAETIWWGNIEHRQLSTDSEGDPVIERPTTIGIIPNTTSASHITAIGAVTKRISDPTHTPPERDPGPNTPGTDIISSHLKINHSSSASSSQSTDVRHLISSSDIQHHVSETTSIIPTTSSDSNPNPGEVAPMSGEFQSEIVVIGKDSSSVGSPAKLNDFTNNTSDIINMNAKTVIVPERTVIMPEQKQHSLPPPRMTDVVMIGHQQEIANQKESLKEDSKETDATQNMLQAPSGVIWPTKNSMAFTIDLGEEPPSKPVPAASNTAFTVDMGADDSNFLNKSLGHSDSLSNFLPQKLRKSFQGRATKAKSETKSKHDKNTGNESDNNPYSSPVSKRRVKGSTPKTLRRSTGYNSDGAHSAMSSDNEDLSMHSEIIRGSSRKSLPAKPSTTVTTPRSSSTRTRSRNTESTHARTARVLEAMSVEKKLEKRIMRSKSAGMNKANPADMFSYSADQSFEETTTTSATTTPRYKEKNVDGEPPSEYQLYQESKHYDNIIQAKTMRNRKESGDGKKKSRISTSTRSLTVPNAKDDDADDISEAGTYTIEVDHDVQSARQSIDQIFNVPNRFDSLRMIAPRRVQKQKAVDRYSSNTDTDINGNVDVHDTCKIKPQNSVDSDSIERDTGRQVDEEEVWHNAKEHQNNLTIEDTATVTVIEPGRIPYVEPSNFTSNNLGHPELSRTPDLHTVQQPSPTSPGSGHTPRRRRKLPTPPVRNPGDSSLLSSPHTPRTSTLEPQIDQDSPGRHRGTLSYCDSDRGIGFTVSFDAPQSQAQDITPEKEMVTPRDDNDDESLVTGMFSATSSHLQSENQSYQYEQTDTARTNGSIDTEILLKDTEQVMRVLEERVGRRLESGDDNLDNDYSYHESRYSPVTKEDLFLDLGNGSDSDASSSCAVVGQSSKLSKPKGQVKTIEVHKPEPKKAGKHKPLSIIKDKSLSHIGGKSGKKLSNSSADFDVFGATDESENESGSIASTSTDYSMSNISHAGSGASPKLQRKGSAGKGSIANTRVNRTFALRRSKADGSDGETPKSEVSTATKSSTRSSRKSVTEKSKPRTSSRSRPSSAKESTRTDASLGQHIVQRSRDNMRGSSSSKDAKDKSLTRKDGGRFSLRNSKSSSSNASSSNATTETRSRSKTEVSTPRSGRSSGGLSVTGTTPKSSQSSKSSNKTEEYKAWQRRHKYDPRKAVADAKAKEKRARSVGNTPEFADTTRPRGDTMDSVSSEDSSHQDEITRLSSMVATDLNMMTHKHDTQTYTEVRSSAFTSITSHSNGSAFKSPAKSTSPLYSPVPVKPKVVSTQYDPVLLSSIQQLSSQLKSQANKILSKLGERRGVDSSQIEDLHCEAVEDASPELSQSLSNLRNTEHFLKVLEREMFSDSDDNTQQELERIHNNESAGFRPIPQARPSKQQPAHSSSKKTSSLSSISKKSSSSKLNYSQDSIVSYTGTEYY